MNKWNRRYFELAKLISTWSKDPSKKIGVVAIGNKGQILSTGYNGFARNIPDSEDILNNREEKYKYIIHGEQNAIYNACLNGISLENSTLYIYGLPICHECANAIIQVGVTKVMMQYQGDVSNKWNESSKLAKKNMKRAGITFMEYNENYESI